jgi:transcriptional regulator with XRE-family HTH domain
MSDPQVGAAFRAVRVRRRLRQSDVAERAGVSRSVVSLIERGHLDHVTIATIRSIAAALDIRLEVVARWRGGELDRLVNADHAALEEAVAASFRALPDWILAAEVSFSIYGERGVIDLVAWHEESRTVLIIELKTLLVDVHDLIAQADRRERLIARIVGERGWQPRNVGVWVVLLGTRTNRRRVKEHEAVLGTAFPARGGEIRRWLQKPIGPIRALSTWPIANLGNRRHVVAGRQRVRRADSVRAAAERPAP